MINVGALKIARREIYKVTKISKNDNIIYEIRDNLNRFVGSCTKNYVQKTLESSGLMGEVWKRYNEIISNLGADNNEA